MAFRLYISSAGLSFSDPPVAFEHFGSISDPLDDSQRDSSVRSDFPRRLFAARNWRGVICICKFDLPRFNARKSFVCINNVDNSQYCRVYCDRSTDSARSSLEISRQLERLEKSIGEGESPTRGYRLVFLVLTKINKRRAN